MPKVKMKVSMAGSDFSYVPGDIINVRDEVAEAWAKNDIAEIFIPPEEKVIVHKEEEPIEEEKTDSVEEEKSEEAKTSPKKKVKKDANTE